MNIKAIALDMDGTTLDSNNTVSRELVHTLKKVQNNDIKVILSTGRTMREIEDVLPADFPYDGAVTSNGMGCYTNNQAVFQYALDPELVKQVIEEAQNNEVYYEMHTKKGNRFALVEDRLLMKEEVYGDDPETLGENERNARFDAFEQKISWEDRLITEDIVKIYFFSKNLSKINKWKQCLTNMKQKKQFTTSSSSDHNVEIMVEGVSKATGLHLLLQHLNVTSEQLLVVGDGENDLPMFEVAGYAVAMNNASELVKTKADEVTNETNDENGLAKYLSNKLFEGIQA
ncbi:Putative phosphatase YwpJ [Paraliobacillus sp. PM-2]|uniref:HAD family hydrolase n=1 Tax=Paraliobacillus sp. PM-2 TaxID=1462524 RepID=UPI00061BC210|nr:HAD family hydrolase [Paraliobacillus sp. PM-2]CQR45932.1 Putative phosphatase YwpJ [Paraliobacillus sp. PM-2]